MLDPATIRLIEDYGELIRLWFCDDVKIDEPGLTSSAKMEGVMEIMNTKIKLLMLSFVRKTSISVDEKWFRTCVTEKLGSLNDYYVEQGPDKGRIDGLG